MNPELKAKWVAALRSGDYRQGRERMRKTNNSYCCLGVLCDVSERGEWEYNDINCLGYRLHEWEPGVMMTSTLSTKMKKEFGIPDGIMWYLVDMNDKGKSFDQIATWIEENL